MYYGVQNYTSVLQVQNSIFWTKGCTIVVIWNFCPGQNKFPVTAPKRFVMIAMLPVAYIIVPQKGPAGATSIRTQ